MRETGHRPNKFFVTILTEKHTHIKFSIVMSLNFILVLGKLTYISWIMDTERFFVFYQDFYLDNNYIYWIILFFSTYFYCLNLSRLLHHALAFCLLPVVKIVLIQLNSDFINYWESNFTDAKNSLLDQTFKL